MAKTTRISKTVKTDRRIRKDGTVKRVTKTRTTVKTVRTTDKPALTFPKGNAKVKDVFTFSLPAGWTCPGASECLAKANRETGKIADGEATVFRCFSASQEAQYPSVRDSRWRNLEALKGKTTEEMVALILSCLPRKAQTVRIHVSGDFFSQAYFDAWMMVAASRPDVLFYAYTKSLTFWIARLGSIPVNLVLTASKGGKHDHLIAAHGLREARVVYSEEDAEALGLPIDHDDSHAMNAEGGDFALLIHGIQPAGSEAARAIKTLRSQGEYGYGEKADARRIALPTLN